MMLESAAFVQAISGCMISGQKTKHKSQQKRLLRHPHVYKPLKIQHRIDHQLVHQTHKKSADYYF